MPFRCAALLFFLSLVSAQQLNCLYYRIRADDLLTIENTRKRPCSSQIPFCVKIIHKMELGAELETSHVDSYIEGRCAFSPDECQNHNTCFPEEPKVHGSSTLREYKCCSKEDYSNSASERDLILHISLHILLVQHFLFG